MTPKVGISTFLAWLQSPCHERHAQISPQISLQNYNSFVSFQIFLPTKLKSTIYGKSEYLLLLLIYRSL